MEPASLALQQPSAALALKRRSENFAPALWFLPARARHGLLAFYRFARHADDIADSAILPREKKLAVLESLERGLKEGTGLPAWAQDYYETTQRGEMDARHGFALLSALLQDADKARYQHWEELVDYSRRSAAPVGRAALELAREWQADIKASDALCISLQILNHLQDLKPDFRDLGRIYLPVGWLENPDHLTGDYAAPDVRRAINEALGRVDGMLQEASRLPRSIRGFRTRFAACTALSLARTLSKKLRHCDPIGIRIRLSAGERLACLLKGLALAAFTRGPKRKDAPHTSFYWPLLHLPREEREAMFALYRFCRATDDAVDEAPSPADAERQIAFWRNEVAMLYSDHPLAYPSHPATRALIPALRRYGLAREHLEGMLEGLAQDASGAMLRPTAYALDRYCYHVASCVGLLSVRIFGCKQPGSGDFALHLGKALQLINILRDVREDAARGRIYLPKELLARYRLEIILPQQMTVHADAFRPVLAELAKQAREHLRQSDEFLPEEDRAALKPALAMRRIYTQYLDMLERQGFDIAAPRVRLPWWKKMRLAM